MFQAFYSCQNESRLRVTFLLFALSPHGILSTDTSGYIQNEPPANKETLRLVQTVVRHGARAPVGRYPNDPYKNESLYWPDGWSELTKEGFHQQFELGKYLRKRYDGFLPEKYSRFDFQCESSDTDRVIQSAEANMVGLYQVPSIVTESGSIEPLWQTVPIHTIPSSIDNYLGNGADCPRFSNYMSNDYPVVTEQYTLQYTELVKFLSENGGFDDKTDFGNLLQIQDALRTEKFYNLTLPDWATDELVATLDHLKALTFEWKIQTDEMKRLIAGPLIKKLIENFKIRATAAKGLTPKDSAFQNLEPFRKMRIFSGHDSTLTNLLVTWGIYDTNIPPFASALMIELHKKSTHPDFIVEVYYRNDTTKVPYLLEIKNCGTPCYLSKLEEVSSQYIPTDWESECQVTSNVPILLKNAIPFSQGAFSQWFQGGWSVASALILLVLVGATVAAILFVRKRKNIRSSINQDTSLSNRYETFQRDSI